VKGWRAPHAAQKNLLCAQVGLQRFEGGNILLKANNVA